VHDLDFDILADREKHKRDANPEAAIRAFKTACQPGHGF
jgi:hypothetical protein